MKEIELRSYQQDFIDAVRCEFIQNHKRVVGVAPCGAGKTIMTGWMIREAARRGKRSIFFVHRNELIEQTAKTFDDLQIPYGIIAASHKMKLDEPVQIASVQTLAKRIEKVPPPDFLICDECHHILANTYKKILDAFPKAFLLGVTATPQRTGGITLCDVFQSMVESLSVNELIARGNLTPFKYFAPNIGVDLTSVREKFGEFVTDDIEEIMADKKIIGGIVEHYKKLASGKQAICYCVNVRHSKSVAEAFNLAGIPAAHVDGETPKNIRADCVEKFRRDELKVLCNCDLFSEGFDVPHCQAVILARPTMSLTLYIQQSMRAMRPDPNDPNKVAIIIDHVQNNLRHGLPNAEHHWSLEPNKKISDKRQCPKCKKSVKPEPTPDHRLKCPNCGFVFPKLESVEPEHQDPDTSEYSGELVEIDTNQETKKSTSEPRIKRKPTTPEEFLKIAKEKKYKIGWVAIQASEHAKSFKDYLHIAEICGYQYGWAVHRWQEHEDEISQTKNLQNARYSC
ncbi:MAG: DEAD/DEAH box helicase [Selenomonadaceae bacterium]|nr:DEAD/DEAH box helicase [Selenomonadaceae bacterium]